MNLLPAEIAFDDGKPFVGVADGDRTSRLPIAGAPGADLAPGRAVVFGIRPEHIAMHNGKEDREVGQLAAAVEVVEPTGAETMAILRVGEHEVAAGLHRDAAPREGQSVTLAVDTAKTSRFDPETKNRI